MTVRKDLADTHGRDVHNCSHRFLTLKKNNSRESCAGLEARGRLHATGYIWTGLARIKLKRVSEG